MEEGVSASMWGVLPAAHDDCTHVERHRGGPAFGC